MLNNDNKILFVEKMELANNPCEIPHSLLEKGDVREGDIFNIGGKFSIFISLKTGMKIWMKCQ